MIRIDSWYMKVIRCLLIVALLLSVSSSVSVQRAVAAPQIQGEQPTPTVMPQAELPAPVETIQGEQPAPTETPQAEQPAPTETPQAEQPAPAVTIQVEQPSPASPEALPGMDASGAAPATPLPTGGSQRILPAETFAQSQLVIDYNPDTQLASFVRAPAGYTIQRPAAAASLQGASQSFLAQYGSLFGLKNPSAELRETVRKKSEGNRSVLRYQQVYQGVPVFGAELMMNLDAANNLISLNGKTISNIDLTVKPKVDAVAAKKSAMVAVARKYKLKVASMKASLPELWIYNPVIIGNGANNNNLAWRMTLTSSEKADLKELAFVDTTKGVVILSFNQVKNTKSLRTYTFNHTWGDRATLVCTSTDGTCATTDTDAIKATLFASDTYDFYYENHGRDSIDNAGMTINSYVHLGTDYGNAYWDGFAMVYGDGFAVDDVVGHELTHGVTEYTSNLDYLNQSGAINESFSDVWGEFVDLSNTSGNDDPSVRWQCGEDLWEGGIRNMKDPTIFHDPDRMQSPHYFLGSGDNGGVHTNSGVNNKAAYLMTDGDTFNGYTINGMGITKVAKIYYEVQNNLLISSSNYLDLYDALYAGCQNLIGTNDIIDADCTNVRNATLAVEMNLSAGGTPPENNNFENSLPASPLTYTNEVITRSATMYKDDPAPIRCTPYGNGGRKLNSVWYQYTAADATPVTFDTDGSWYDTLMSVWTGSRGSLSQKSCVDDALYNYDGQYYYNGSSRVTFVPTAGITYYIMISSYYGDGGTLKFNASQATCFTLTKTAIPVAGGTITASPTNSSGCSSAGTYLEKELITLTANPNLYYHFGHWGSTSVSATSVMVEMLPADFGITGTFVANLKTGTYNDNYAGIVHTSGWLTQAGPFYTSLTQHYTKTRGSTITIYYTGKIFKMYYTAGKTYGKVSIQIDANAPVVLNEYALLTGYKKLWTSPKLANANHKAVITYYASNPTNTYVNFDGVIIQ